MAVLNHASVCVSYVSAWQYLRQLTTEAQYLEVVREGHWIWVYDNVNIHQKVRHEREGQYESTLCSFLYLFSILFGQLHKIWGGGGVTLQNLCGI